jgi:hypothetical protein
LSGMADPGEYFALRAATAASNNGSTLARFF